MTNRRDDPNWEIFEEVEAVMGAAKAYEDGTTFEREHDASFEQILREAETALENGGIIFQQWTCGDCGKRQTMDAPNQFHPSGQCGSCGHTTNLQKDGCGFRALFGPPET
jgi:rubrerythrin